MTFIAGRSTPRSPKCGVTYASLVFALVFAAALPALPAVCTSLCAEVEGKSRGLENVHIDLPNVDSQAGLIFVMARKM
jgi:hypothetical protein